MTLTALIAEARGCRIDKSLPRPRPPMRPVNTGSLGGSGSLGGEAWDPAFATFRS